MSDFEQFRDDPLQPEFRESIRPLTLAESDQLMRMAEGQASQARGVKRRHLSNAIFDCGWAGLWGMIFATIVSPLWFIPVGYLWENWSPGRPMTMSEERITFFLPLLVGMIAGASYSLTRESRVRSRHQRRADEYRSALQRGLMHVVTIRSVRCLYDFSEDKAGNVFSTGRIIYELPSGRFVAVDRFDPLEADKYSRSVVQFCMLPDCRTDFEVVSSDGQCEVECYLPGELPRPFRKAPTFRLIDQDGRLA